LTKATIAVDRWMREDEYEINKGKKQNAGKGKDERKK
jgi:hypothetical protein